MTDNQIAERAVLNALRLGIARLSTIALRSRLGLNETRRALQARRSRAMRAGAWRAVKLLDRGGRVTPAERDEVRGIAAESARRIAAEFHAAADAAEES